MSISHESTLRNGIVKALKESALYFGFDKQGGNIKDYLIDYETGENRTAYLMSDVSGRKLARAIGVQVEGDDAEIGAGQLRERTYRVTVQIYQAIETNGAGINSLIDNLVVARKVILDMGATLNSMVNLIRNPISSSLSRRSDLGTDIILVGTISFSAIKRQPNY
jgi:hypothetical protein